MSGCGSPCGACKFLRRKCVRGCVFAPYFCHDQGATHFAAIHKVFGASNVSKLLAHLPLTHRCQAALSISYEAQARLHDPIYGCVSHIFALQQQVVNLQAQLAYLKEQALLSQSFVNASASSTENPKPTTTTAAADDDDLQGWFLQTQNYSNDMGPQVLFGPNNSSSTTLSAQQHYVTDLMNMDPNPNNSGRLQVQQEETISFSSFHDISCDMQQTFHQLDDLHSLAFGFTPSASSSSIW
ncbi:LOB domain-containing protein 29-like [Senna tora]|uniref:LOB domain-containing protein 29-like n=1 Tax=Senna tora TaxID=362788 RepID=A0A834SLA6_9FABA|nr:LOB domain-containing protein 29-like [Senna tora]